MGIFHTLPPPAKSSRGQSGLILLYPESKLVPDASKVGISVVPLFPHLYSNGDNWVSSRTEDNATNPPEGATLIRS